MIKEAKIFQNGQSQAVRLPKEFRFKGKSVYINKVGDCVMLIPQKNPWSGLIKACSQFSEDFMNQRDDQEPEEREWPQ